MGWRRRPWGRKRRRRVGRSGQKRSTNRLSVSVGGWCRETVVVDVMLDVDKVLRVEVGGGGVVRVVVVVELL